MCHLCDDNYEDLEIDRGDLPRNTQYRVYMRSVPGMWTHYAGSVDVWAADEDDAFDKAKDAVKRGAFSDRPRNTWILDKVEKL